MWTLLILACEPVALRDLAQLNGYWVGTHQTALEEELCTSTDELLVSGETGRGIFGGDVCGSDATYVACDLNIPRPAALVMTDCESGIPGFEGTVTETQRSFEEVWLSHDTLYMDTLILQPGDTLIMEATW